MTLRQVIAELREEGWRAAREERIRVARMTRWERWVARLLGRYYNVRWAAAAHYESQALIAASNRLVQRARWEALGASATTVDPRPAGSFLRKLTPLGQPTASQPSTSERRRSWRR